MKAYDKKKAYRRVCKANAKAGLINRPDGTWVNRAQVAATSMARDYHPQR